MTKPKALGNAELVANVCPMDSPRVQAIRGKLLGYRNIATFGFGGRPYAVPTELANVFQTVMLIAGELAFTPIEADAAEAVLNDAREACILLLRAAERIERLYIDEPDRQFGAAWFKLCEEARAEANAGTVQGLEQGSDAAALRAALTARIAARASLRVA